MMAGGRKSGCGSNWKTFRSPHVLAELPHLLGLKGEVEVGKVHVPRARTHGWYTRFWGGGDPSRIVHSGMARAHVARIW